MFQEVIGDPRWMPVKEVQAKGQERKRFRQLGDFIHEVIPVYPETESQMKRQANE